MDEKENIPENFEVTYRVYIYTLLFDCMWPADIVYIIQVSVHGRSE